MKFLPGLHSPAYPAAWLLFGMVFALAMAHFVAISWSSTATVVVYVVPLVWVFAIAWRRRQTPRVGKIDILFLLFALLVLVSSLFAMQDGGGEAARKYLRYLPIMMVSPYLCGRSIRVPDINLLLRITLFAGVATLPLLLLDRFLSPRRDGGRWPFFGLDYGALLVGVLLAAALIALCVRMVGGRNPGVNNNGRLEGGIYLGLIGIVTVSLVWVSARGWLIAGLAGVVAVTLSMRTRTLGIRSGLLAYVLAIATCSMMILPSSTFYSKLLTAPVTASVTAGPGPILGEASCQPFKGVNSVAVRWVLYQEALAMFAERPVLGVGATRFGERSCIGPGGYPHSTILQSFAELGLIGGGLLIVLIVFASVTLVRLLITARRAENEPAYAFILALFAMFLVADQFYGNYFMSTGTWLLLGIAASMYANAREALSHG